MPLISEIFFSFPFINYTLKYKSSCFICYLMSFRKFVIQREVSGLVTLQNRALIRTVATQEIVRTKGWKRQNNEDIHNIYSTDFMGAVKLMRLRYVEKVRVRGN